MLVAYLDEFGHIGPFISRNDPKHNDSPVFGFAGIVLPSEQIRSFATWFYQRKCELLAFEIEKSQCAAYLWEKKGSSLYTRRNIEQYRQVRVFTNRFFAELEKRNGFVFYVGTVKNGDTASNDPKTLYKAVLREAVHRLNQESEARDTHFMLVMDEHEERQAIITDVSCFMFAGRGDRKANRLVEPPFQVESHRYQTIQAADWICGLIGRFGQYRHGNAEWEEYACVEKYFAERLNTASLRSSIRHFGAKQTQELAAME